MTALTIAAVTAFVSLVVFGPTLFIFLVLILMIALSSLSGWLRNKKFR